MREKSESELSKWKRSIKGRGEWRGRRRRRRIEEKGTDEVGIPIAAADSDSGLVGRGRTSSSASLPPSFLPPPSLPLSFITLHTGILALQCIFFSSSLHLLRNSLSTHGNKKLQFTISIILIFLFIIFNFKISENRGDLIQ